MLSPLPAQDWTRISRQTTRTSRPARIAKARGLNEAQVNQLIQQHTTGRTLGLLGEPRVNVLELNLALDNLSK